MNKLFFELIRVAIGTQDALTRVPSAHEWELLYTMAKKQSLVGICFAGVQRPCASEHEDYCGMSELLYLKWIGMAAKIQQRNQIANQRCVELQDLLDGDGFESVILKGQGVARLYGSLAGLRQSGDIDVWMCPQGEWNLRHDERMVRVVRYLKSKAKCGNTTYHNTSWNVFTDIEVEAHYTPSWLYSPIRNRRLQKWFESVAETEMKDTFSSLAFNSVFVLQHIYRHLFGEGIGLRQVLDCYFVLKAWNECQDDIDSEEFRKLLKSLGMQRFTQGLLWVIQHVFIGDNLSTSQTFLDTLGLKADEHEGAFLLSEIMQAGNFGHYDERISRKRKGLLGGFWLHVKRNMHFVTHYPSEVLWCPLWKVWHQLWLLKIKKEI